MGTELEASRLQVGNASLNAKISAATLTRPPARRKPLCSTMHAMRSGLRFVSQACFDHCNCPLGKVGDQPRNRRHNARQSLGHHPRTFEGRAPILEVVTVVGVGSLVSEACLTAFMKVFAAFDNRHLRYHHTSCSRIPHANLLISLISASARPGRVCTS